MSSHPVLSGPEQDALRPEQVNLKSYGVQLKESARGKGTVLLAPLQSIRKILHHAVQMRQGDKPGQGHARDCEVHASGKEPFESMQGGARRSAPPFHKIICLLHV